MLPALVRACATRFAVVGLAMTALHLAVFALLTPWVAPELANVVAFLTATQVNFSLSYSWTWSSRRSRAQETVGYVLRRAVLFNSAAALSLGVNAAVFSAAYRVAEISPMGSVLAATTVSAVTSFVLSSRVVFARRPVLDAAQALYRTEPDPGPVLRVTEVRERV